MSEHDQICDRYFALSALMHSLADTYERMETESADDVVRRDTVAHLCRALACRGAPSVVDVLHQAAHDGLTKQELIEVYAHSIAILMAHLQETEITVEVMNDPVYLSGHYSELFQVFEFYRVETVKRGLAAGGSLRIQPSPSESVH